MLVLHVMRSIYIDKEKFYKKRDVLEKSCKDGYNLCEYVLLKIKWDMYTQEIMN